MSDADLKNIPIIIINNNKKLKRARGRDIILVLNLDDRKKTLVC